MTSTVLKAIAIQRSVHAEEGEEIKVEKVGLDDIKSEELQEITAMEFINKHRPAQSSILRIFLIF